MRLKKQKGGSTLTIWPDDYVQYVLEDIKKHDTKSQVVHASLLERIRIRKVDPLLLHPNPDDEFSMEDIGPSMQIVSDYLTRIRRLNKFGKTIFEEPVICEKLKHDGYLLVNGHHRWYAALKAGVEKLHIRIVNLVHTEDINRMLNATTNIRCVTFDLDEVLLTKDSSDALYPKILIFQRNYLFFLKMVSRRYSEPFNPEIMISGSILQITTLKVLSIFSSL